MKTSSLSNHRRAKQAAGLVGLGFWLQLALQNLYVACVYQDHVVRESTVITGFFMAGAVLGAAALLLAGRRCTPGRLRHAGLASVPMLALLLWASDAVTGRAGIALSSMLGFGLGLFSAALVTMWAHALRHERPLDCLRLLLETNLASLLALFALFCWFGEVIWFDFMYSWQGTVLKAVVALAGCSACALCPVADSATTAETAIAQAGPVPRRTAWRNFFLGQWRIYLGLFILAFCTTLHWEINAMRNGKSLNVAWELFGHHVAATGMAVCYLALAAAIIVIGCTLVRLMADRCHMRTLATVLFYATGCAFSIPGLFGFAAVSPAGFTMVGMFLFCTLSFVLLLQQLPVVEVPATCVTALYTLVLAVGLSCGLLASWAMAPTVNGSDVFCIALTALSLFIVMVAPNFLFKTSVPSMAPEPEADLDATAARCREIARQGQLSPRETEVMELAARGFSVPAIANSLFIAENTAKVHMRHIYEKLGLHSKQELIRLMHPK